MWKWIRVVFLEAFRILFIDLFYLIRYSRHPEKYPLEKRYKVVRNLIAHLLKSYWVDWKVENKQILDSLNERGEKALIVSNHLSFTDALSMIAVSEKPLAFVAKKETYKMFIVGRCARAIGCYFLDREDLRQSLKIIRDASNTLKEGKSHMLIFPEGTRNKDLRAPLLDMHPGSLKTGTLAKATIIVVASYGNHRVLDGKISFKRHLVQYKFLKEYKYDDYKSIETTELIKDVKDTLQSGVNELREYDDKYHELGYQNISLRKGPLTIK